VKRIPVPQSDRDEIRLLRRWLAVILVIGIGWRLIRYALQLPIWGDEAAVCLNFLERGYRGLTTPLANGAEAPILFLWAEYTVSKVAGLSEIALRFLPVIIGVSSLFVFLRFARGVAGPTVAAIAVGILAVSYYPVRHCCEVKPYSFDLLVASALLLLAHKKFNDERNPWAAGLLICFLPFALGLSYPAVFVAAAIVLVEIPRCFDKNTNREWAFLFVYGGLLVALFLLLQRFVAADQFRFWQKDLTAVWKDSFPPASLWPLAKWLVATHTGNMFAYPIGGRHGGTTVMFLLCLAGIAEFFRQRRFSVLTLLLAPFAFTFIAAALRRYPYGGSARIAQHLAPAICLLIAAGIGAVLQSHWFRNRRRMVLNAIFIILAAIGIVGITRDLVKPYKTLDDERVRAIVGNLFAQAAANDLIVVAESPGNVPPSLQWYLRRQNSRISWNDELNLDRLRGAAVDVWHLTLWEDKNATGTIAARLAKSNHTYQLVSKLSETLGIGPVEMPPTQLTIEHWSAKPER
jgi:uncharacterized membrane protein